MPTSALELNYLELLKTNTSCGSNTSHTTCIMVTHMQVKYWVIRMHTGMACGNKSVTKINNYI